MKRLIVFMTLLVLMVLLVPVGGAYAASPHLDRVIETGETVKEDVVIFGGSLVLEEGGEVDGDVAVFGGVATLAGQVDGDVAVFGGTVELRGDIDGDLVILGGALEAGGSADVSGDCILVGGSLTGDGEDKINCTTVGDFPGFAIPAIVGVPDVPTPPAPPEIPAIPEIPSVPRSTFLGGFFGTIAEVTGRSLILGIIALVMAAVAPSQLSQVRGTVAHKPAASGVVGALTVIAVPSIAVLLAIVSAVLTIICIGLLGFPILIVLLVGFGVAIVMGWVAVGVWLGERLAGWLKLQNTSLLVTAALGTVVLTLVTGFLGALPFLLGGWLWTIATLIVSCAGLGAVALTRFGTRPYPPGSAVNGEKVGMVLETLPVEDGPAK